MSIPFLFKKIFCYLIIFFRTILPVLNYFLDIHFKTSFIMCKYTILINSKKVALFDFWFFINLRPRWGRIHSLSLFFINMWTILVREKGTKSS